MQRPAPFNSSLTLPPLRTPNAGYPKTYSPNVPATQSRPVSTRHGLPSTYSRLPSNQNRVPSTQNRLPSTQSRLAATESRLSSTQVRLPSIRNRLPSTYNRLSSDPNRVPHTQNRLPSTQHRLLSTPNSPTSAYNRLPATAHSRPSTTHSSPATIHSRPATTHSRPVTTHSRPATTQGGGASKPVLSQEEVHHMRQLVRLIPAVDAQKLRKIYAKVGNSQTFRDVYNSLVLELRAKASLSGTPAPTLPLWPSASAASARGGVASRNGGVASSHADVASSNGGVASNSGGVVSPRGGVVFPNRAVTSSRGGVASPSGGVASLRGGVAGSRNPAVLTTRAKTSRFSPRSGSGSTLFVPSRSSLTPHVDELQPWRVQARRLPVAVQRRLKTVYDRTGDTAAFRELVAKAVAKYLPANHIAPVTGKLETGRTTRLLVCSTPVIGTLICAWLQAAIPIIAVTGGLATDQIFTCQSYYLSHRYVNTCEV